MRAVGQFQARGLGEGRAGGRADRREHVVRRVLLAVVGAGGEDHAVLADDLGEPGAEVEADAVLGVQVGEHLADLGAEDGVQRGRLGLDDGDLGAVLAGGRGDLQADPAGAGDDQVAVVPAEGGQDAPEPVGVGEAAQVVDAREVGAGDVQAAGLGAGGEQQLVVADDGAVARGGRSWRRGRWRRRSGRGAARCRRCAYQAGSWTKTLSRSSLPRR